MSDTKRKILESGKKLFLQDGYEKCNLRAICKGAGVTTGAFYRHFTDKEDLFSALVEPLANDIFGFYARIEEESYEKINSNELEKLSEISKKGTVETVRFLYSRKEEYILLINGSYGTKYNDFLERIVEKEDQNKWNVSSSVSKVKGLAEIVSKSGMHILNHAYINILSEIVMHSESVEEAEKNAVMAAEFFGEGWKKLRGF